MPAPSLKKEMLLEADWLRELCSEAISASCPSCGSPIDLASGDSSEKECWVCTWKGTPIYQCAKCSQPCETSSGAERECQSVSAFESRAFVAFQPEGEVWFHKKSASGKIRCTTEADLLDALNSGELKPSTLVCNIGADSFEKANEHSQFSGILAPPEPPPTPILPTPVPVPVPELGHVPARKNFVATLLAFIFGPVGLLYISWKLSICIFILHLIACSTLGWPKWAVISFWQIIPGIIAYSKTRNIPSALSLPSFIVRDAKSNLLFLIGLLSSAYLIIKRVVLSGIGVFSTGVIFLAGFLFGGSIKTGQWLANSSYIHFIIFFILSIYLTKISLNISKKYIESIKNGHKLYFYYPILTDTLLLRSWLRWSAVILMFILTCRLWEENAGPIRLVLIASTCGLPFLPIVGSIIGSFAIGCISGLLSLLVSGMAAGVFNFIYKLIMK